MSQNRYYQPINVSNKAQYFINNSKCVFISYQSQDREAAKKIADYILAAGIDVYFDQYDGDLRIANQSKNPKALVESLCKGVNSSSHMLAVVSPNTLQSRWVPFEIGFGYDKTEVITLCLKGIPVGSLPEYLRTKTVIRDVYDLNRRLSDFAGQSFQAMKVFNRLKDEDYTNPLLSVMDGLIADTYRV
ncbi:toll/interleukin-1 receptor domain-containing protein [Chitinophaga sp. 30R24]|uniref:toll/interleukin-1 receptor domain-containing protein n=1 Tax=Chitinophaga sp. 30R24 TaxID=3248838 RepID=UPI003B8ECE75